MIVLYRYFLLAVIAATAPAALAQPTARSAPADPAAAAPAAKHESAFGDYVPYREPKIAPWRDINDEAARIGGHAGAMRQSGARGNTPAAPSPARPAMPGHGGHH